MPGFTALAVLFSDFQKLTYVKQQNVALPFTTSIFKICTYVHPLLLLCTGIICSVFVCFFLATLAPRPLQSLIRTIHLLCVGPKARPRNCMDKRLLVEERVIKNFKTKDCPFKGFEYCKLLYQCFSWQKIFLYYIY